MLPGLQLEGDAWGVALAVSSGALTSGLGYALWYSVLARMTGSTAAVVQLAVPVLAIVAGAVVLGESAPPILILAAALVVGGIGWAVTARR